MKNEKKESKFKEIAEKVLKETKESRHKLDELDDLIVQKQLTSDSMLEMARKAAGYGNSILKQYHRIKALLSNAKSDKYMQLKIDADITGEKFVSATANGAASQYVNDLRLLRDILEAYVTSANNILSVCRLHKTEQYSDSQISGNL